MIFHARQDSLGWKRWYSEEKAENADLPRSARDLNQFQRLFLLRVMRQDRFLEFQKNNGWSRGHWSFLGKFGLLEVRNFNSQGTSLMGSQKLGGDWRSSLKPAKKQCQTFAPI